MAGAGTAESPWQIADYEDLKAVGIENYVHVRCNVLETLRDFNSKLNIK